ncbi:MAG TPA: molecular chaperone DnaK, partial [Rhodospirillaceae bacterium]|nr:molecular chaperone DnaK [Rhodospirillaceae bacterium]
ASGGLSDTDIDQMVKDAEVNAEEDKKRREGVDARNHADALIHTTEKTLTDAGDKVDAADKEAVEKAIAELKEVLDSGDSETIKAKTEALTQAAMKIGEAMYKAQQEETAAAGGEAGGEGEQEAPKEEGVVDAEFSEVKDEK